MIKHKKVSAKPNNTDETVVAGPDWNDDHVHEYGSLIPVGLLLATWNDYTTQFENVNGTIAFAATAAVETSTGNYRFVFVPPEIQVRADCAVYYRAHLSLMPYGTMPIGWSVVCSAFFDEGDEECVVSIAVLNDSNESDELPLKALFDIVVFAEVDLA